MNNDANKKQHEVVTPTLCGQAVESFYKEGGDISLILIDGTNSDPRNDLDTLPVKR